MKSAYARFCRTFYSIKEWVRVNRHQLRVE